VSGRSYLSIGDVLSLLRQEFPDVTISKIRFLESQGLVSPERTPSGYRKFYDEDVARLRWILRQQREHFLPLKVIKGRLEAAGGRPPLETETPGSDAGATPSERDGPAPAGAPGPGAAQGPGEVQGPAAAVAGNGADAGVLPGFPPPASVAAAGRPTAPRPARSAASDAPPVPAADPAPGPEQGLGYSLGELAAASGLSSEAIGELVAFGLVHPIRQMGGEPLYDEWALAVAKVAAGFAQFGIEARHLRLYKHAAEREAGFVEQVVLPLLRQRNPEARQRARATASELVELGQELRRALVAQALADLIG
jgi:DNA-binding transcriptional MerR regulator